MVGIVRDKFSQGRDLGLRNVMFPILRNVPDAKRHTPVHGDLWMMTAMHHSKMVKTTAAQLASVSQLASKSDSELEIEIADAATRALPEDLAREGPQRRVEASRIETSRGATVPAIAIFAMHVQLNIVEIAELPMRHADANVLEMIVLPMKELAEVVSKLPPREAPHPSIGALGVRREPENPGAG